MVSAKEREKKRLTVRKIQGIWYTSSLQVVDMTRDSVKESKHYEARQSPTRIQSYECGNQTGWLKCDGDLSLPFAVIVGGSRYARQVSTPRACRIGIGCVEVADKDHKENDRQWDGDES